MKEFNIFFDWVECQNPETEIDHNSLLTCAIGKYAKSLGESPRYVIYNMSIDSDMGKDLMQVLNHRPTARTFTPTFGDLLKLQDSDRLAEARKEVPLYSVIGFNEYYLS